MHRLILTHLFSLFVVVCFSPGNYDRFGKGALGGDTPIKVSSDQLVSLICHNCYLAVQIQVHCDVKWDKANPKVNNVKVTNTISAPYAFQLGLKIAKSIT